MCAEPYSYEREYFKQWDYVDELQAMLRQSIKWLDAAYRDVDSETASRVKAHLPFAGELLARVPPYR